MLVSGYEQKLNVVENDRNDPNRWWMIVTNDDAYWYVGINKVEQN